MKRSVVLRGLVLLAAVACFALPVRAGDEPIRESGVKVPLPEGGHLTAEVVRPAGPGRYPTIYVHTCYGRRHVSSPAADSPFRKELTAYDRYAYVATDWRNYPPRAGQPVDPNADPGRDGAAAVEWIARQSWSDGKVGVWGHSAVAGAAYKIMREQPPHLVCAVPASCSGGIRYEQFFYGGVLEKQHWDVGTRVGHHVLRPLLTRNTYDWLWRKIDRDRKPMPSRIPVLLISGWYDTNPALKFDVFDELRRTYGHHADRVKLLLGPWHHSAFGMLRQGGVEFPAARGRSSEETLRFFDRHLRGESNGWDERPAVSWFEMGANEWRTGKRWPPADGRRTLHLTPDGGLSAAAPDEAGAVTWTHDPEDPVPTTGGASILEFSWTKVKAGPFDLRPILDRPDLRRFETDVLDRKVVVTGRAKAVLQVSTDAEDTDVAVWLADVAPDGSAVLVADGIQRLSFRESRSRPRPMTPGRAEEVTVTLTPTAVAFRPGHRILLAVASSNYPRFDRHPLKARNTLHLGAAHPSRLVLPAAEKAPAVEPGRHEFRLPAGGLERSWVVHVPPAAKSGDPRPVVLMFHGGGGTAGGAIEETGWTAKADAAGFLAVFPEGTRPDPSRPASFRGNPQTWNDGSGRETVGAVERGVDDVDFVRRVLDDLEARFEVDTRRVYVTGFSNGAAMAFRVGRELSSRVAAIAPVAGSDWRAGSPEGAPPPLLYVTGTADPLNPIGGGPIEIGGVSFGEKPPVRKMLKGWARLAGARGKKRVIHDCGGVKRVAFGPKRIGRDVDLVTVEDHGHHWPGGRARLPESIAGPRSDALDATALIWRFFETHPRLGGD